MISSRKYDTGCSSRILIFNPSGSGTLIEGGVRSIWRRLRLKVEPETVQICLLVVGYPITMMRSKIRISIKVEGRMRISIRRRHIMSRKQNVQLPNVQLQNDQDTKRPGHKTSSFGKF